MTTMTKPDFKVPADIASGPALEAVVSPAPLAGSWANTDHATRGIIKLVIATSGTGMTVDAFGACTPTPCNWGVVPGVAYAETVSATPAVAFSAQYKFAFKTTIVVGHLSGKILTVETFDVFTDGSGRSSYYSVYKMTK